MQRKEKEEQEEEGDEGNKRVHSRMSKKAGIEIEIKNQGAFISNPEGQELDFNEHTA